MEERHPHFLAAAPGRAPARAGRTIASGAVPP